MSDQQPPAEVQDTAAVAGPIEAPGTAESTPDTNWQERYEHAQSWGTRSAQEAAELRLQNEWLQVFATTDDPATRQQAAEVLGIELAAEEEEEFEPAEYEDPYEQFGQRVERIEQRLSQEDQQARQAMENEFISDHAHAELARLGVTDEDTKRFVFERALGLDWQPAGPGRPAVPNIQAAHDQYQAWVDSQQKSWAKTKRAPFVSSGGRDATEAPVLGPNATHEQRVAYAAQKYQEMQDSE